MSKELDIWSRRVAAFGGRIKPGAELEEPLQNANMGGRAVVLSSLATVPVVRKTLSEVRLPKPIPLDVVVSLPNQAATDSSLGLDPGNGHIRLTWGVSGGVTHTATVDLGHGWIHTMTASFLRVEYVSVGETFIFSGLGQPVPPLQSADLQVIASIGPSSGYRQTQLTRTRYWPSLPPSVELSIPVPPFAQNVTFSAGLAATSGLWDTEITFSAGADVLSTISFVQNNAGQPSFAPGAFLYNVPQRAIRMGWLNSDAVNTMTFPTATFGLAI